jgi:hypothetical protein
VLLVLLIAKTKVATLASSFTGPGDARISIISIQRQTDTACHHLSKFNGDVVHLHSETVLGGPLVNLVHSELNGHLVSLCGFRARTGWNSDGCGHFRVLRAKKTQELSESIWLLSISGSRSPGLSQAWVGTLKVFILQDNLRITLLVGWTQSRRGGCASG